jgi:hypothetical protein
MRNRYARRTGTPDANESAIVTKLQDRGAIVLVLDRPVDLVVGYRGRWVLVEVKAGPKARIKKAQKDFIARCLLQSLPCYLIDDIADLDVFFPVNSEPPFAGVL